MTAFDRIEPRLPELIDELATARVPDYFDDLLQTTAAARQRPAWRSPERWLPMGVIARPLPTRSLPWRSIAVVAMLGLLLAGTILVAGSRTRVPDPFGLAANGSLYYHGPDGAIHAADPTTGTTRVVVPGDTTVAYPLPSRDGQRIVYDHTEGGTTQLFVADADGENVHPLAGTYEHFTWTEWSPDGSEIAIISRVDFKQSLSILATDGSAARTVPLDRDVQNAFWLPDGRFVLTAAESPAVACRPDVLISRCEIFVVAADGTGLRRIADAGLSLSVSPDGRTLLYVRWTDAEPGRLHRIDVASGTDTAVPVEGLDPAGENANLAEFSPDGSHILFDRLGSVESRWGVVPTAGGVATSVGPAWPPGPDGTGPEAHWSPDGRSILAFYPTLDGANELWLLDPAGDPDEDQRLDLSVDYAPAFQRVAP